MKEQAPTYDSFIKELFEADPEAVAGLVLKRNDLQLVATGPTELREIKRGADCIATFCYRDEPRAPPFVFHLEGYYRDETRVWEVPAARLLRQSVALAALAPFGAGARLAHACKAAKRIMKEVADPERRQRLGSLLLMAVALTMDEALDEVHRRLEMDLIDVPAGQRILRQGILQGRRESVMDVLVDRFGTVPTSLVEVVLACEDPELLKQAHRLALHDSAEVILEHLQAARSAGSSPDGRKPRAKAGERKPKARVGRSKPRDEAGPKKPPAKADKALTP